jgi:hypothetical protein
MILSSHPSVFFPSVPKLSPFDEYDAFSTFLVNSNSSSNDPTLLDMNQLMTPAPHTHQPSINCTLTLRSDHRLFKFIYYKAIVGHEDDDLFDEYDDDDDDDFSIRPFLPSASLVYA